MTDNTPPSSSKKRGITKLIKLFKSRNEERKVKIEVVNGQPVPSKNTDQLVSFVGMVGRRNVPISYQKWKDVPKELKEKLWDEITRTFEGVDEIRHDLFITMGESWRTWKSRIYSQYVKDVDDPEVLKTPPPEYDFITPDDWKSFVEYRTTPKFRELSDANIEKAKQQKYFHTTSRKGYAGLRHVMEEKAGGTPIPREELWKSAHKRKSGQFISEDASLVAQRIDELATQASEGLLTVHGKDDILTRVIGPEHPGRVRAGGKHVVPSKFFQEDRRRRSSVHGDELASIRAELEAQKRAHKDEMAEMKEKMEKMYQMFMAQQRGDVPSYTPASTSAQYTPASTSAQEHEDVPPRTPPAANAEALIYKGMECELFVDGIDELIRVGTGTVVNPGGVDFVLHTEVQPSYGMCSVILTYTYDVNAALPCPNDEIRTVGEAAGYVLGWPTRLVRPISTTTPVVFPGQITYAPGTTFFAKT